MTRREEVRLEGESRCIEAAQNRGGVFIGPYSNFQKKTKWNCGKHTFETSPACVLSYGTWCKQCADENLKSSMSKVRLEKTGYNSWEERMTEAAAKRDGEFIGPYVNGSIKTKWKCKIGHIFDMAPHMVTRSTRNQWCPECAKKIVGQKHKEHTLKQKGFTSYEEYMQDLANKNKGLFIGPYTQFDEFTNWKCQKGHEFRSKPRYVWSGMWCQFCSALGVSKAQTEIFEFIKSIIPEKEVTISNKKILKNHELDIYVPNLKFGLEHDGLYWHSEANEGYKNSKSMNKALESHSLGINYLMIFEDEWKKKKDLVKKMIEWRLKKFNGVSLNARDLELRKMDHNHQFDWFFDKFHLDGHSQASYAYGLFYEDKLISCASVRTNFNKEVEICRLATDYNYNVRGAAGKLISKLPRPLISYSNNRLGIGNIYKNLGFKEITKSHSPSYFYTDLKTRIWRWQCKRNNDPAILAEFPTEKDQALGGVFSQKIFGDKRPLYRIEDCGHKKWILEK